MNPVGMTDRHRVTHMFAPPSMVQMLTAEPSRAARDLASLECLLVGGAPITDATALGGRAAFGDVLYQVFGQTEAVPLTVMTPEPGVRITRATDVLRFPVAV